MMPRDAHKPSGGAPSRRFGPSKWIILLIGAIVMVYKLLSPKGRSLPLPQPGGSHQGTQQTKTSRVIEITTQLVKQHDTSKLERLKVFSRSDYEEYMMGPPGKEHYPLLHYLTHTYGDGETPVVDIGTRFVASALALGASGTPVRTFDLPTSRERIQAFRGRSEDEWQALVKEQHVKIEFYNFNLVEITDMAFKTLLSTWLILLDTLHLPDSSPFERELVNRLITMEYKGLLLLDDIHFNSEMEKWWQELKDQAAKDGYVAYDVTSIGHYSGTGLIDFGRNAKVSLE